MKINELKDMYFSGEINKPDYIKDMYNKYHALLHDYKKLIKDSNISKIEITESEIIMTDGSTGMKIICPEYDHRVAPIEALNFGSYEKYESEWIYKCASKSSLFLDIGANMGWYAISTALINSDLQVHAFEPVPSTFRNLSRNTLINDVRNVSLHNFGLSDVKSNLDFYYDKEGSGNASSKNLSDRDDVLKLSAEVMRLDDLDFIKNKTIDFIKIDVEGAELLVIKGASIKINKDKPMIFCELLRKWSSKFGYHPNDLISLLGDMGYKCYAIGVNSRKIDCIDENTIETNYLFLDPEKHKTFISEHLGNN